MCGVWRPPSTSRRRKAAAHDLLTLGGRDGRLLVPVPTFRARSHRRYFYARHPGALSGRGEAMNPAGLAIVPPRETREKAERFLNRIAQARALRNTEGAPVTVDAPPARHFDTPKPLDPT